MKTIDENFELLYADKVRGVHRDGDGDGDSELVESAFFIAHLGDDIGPLRALLTPEQVEQVETEYGIR